MSYKNALIEDVLDFPFEVKLAGDDRPPGTIEGYGSVFGLLDRGGDMVMKGAFKKTLREWKKLKQLPQMLWSHDMSNIIGLWTDMEEDDKGLKLTGELVLEVPQAQVAYALMKRNAVKGLSIGYRTRDYEIDRTTGVRKLKEVELYEVSLVSVPMLAEAQVTGVKSGVPFDAPGWEKIFREGGLSNRDAKLATSLVRKGLRDGDKTGEDPVRDGLRDLLLNLRVAQQVTR
jgi:HK97 family phage prohead protease